jgi:hypothetical protein
MWRHPASLTYLKGEKQRSAERIACDASAITIWKDFRIIDLVDPRHPISTWKYVPSHGYAEYKMESLRVEFQAEVDDVRRV